MAVDAAIAPALAPVIAAARPENERPLLLPRKPRPRPRKSKTVYKTTLQELQLRTVLTVNTAHSLY